MLRFEWDPHKDAADRAKHGIGFDEAAQIFDAPHLTRRDGRRDYGEDRFVSLGRCGGAVILVVAHTNRGGAIRIISARRASRREREVHHERTAQIREGPDRT